MPIDWIEQHREDLLAFAARLVATPSMNPPGDERAVVKVVRQELARYGLDKVEIAACDPQRPNLILRLKGSGPGPTLMLCGHSDTKPVGDPSMWSTDPLEPVVHDGRLYGLGSTDMKGAVAAMVYATAALHQCGADLAGDLLLVVNADEERTMRFGSEFLSSEYGIKADVALLGEPSGIGIDKPEFEFLHLLSRGICCFRVVARGTQMHSSLSDRMGAVNASVKLANVLCRLDRDLKLRFDPHPLCAAPTINLGVRIEGGVAYGVYPGLAECCCDVRILPGMTLKQLTEDIQAVLDAARRDDPELNVKLQFEDPPRGWIEPTEVGQEHPLVEAILEAADQVLGWRPRLSAFPGASDAAKFQGVANIPTIPSFGPGWLGLAHGPNECVGVEAIVQAAKVYGLVARSYLGTAS